ncbi:MAG: hypothetical protein AAF824_04180 [Bacteroidota bacterium]
MEHIKQGVLLLLTYIVVGFCTTNAQHILIPDLGLEKASVESYLENLVQINIIPSENLLTATYGHMTGSYEFTDDILSKVILERDFSKEENALAAFYNIVKLFTHSRAREVFFVTKGFSTYYLSILKEKVYEVRLERMGDGFTVRLITSKSSMLHDAPLTVSHENNIGPPLLQ